MNRTLCEKDRTVLVAAQLKANATTAALERDTGLLPHVIRHSLGRLLASGILTPYTLVNVSPLGFDKVAIFFSLSTNDLTLRKRALDFLLGLRCVVSVSELIGDYEYFMSVACRSVSELAATLGHISESLGFFRQHAISTRSALYLYQRTYLAQVRTPREFVAYNLNRNRIELGTECVALLTAIDDCGVPSPASLARRTGQPLSSVTYRLSRMEQSGVIVGYLFGVRVGELGITMHDILLSTRSSGLKMRDAMHRFCLGEPNLIGMAHCIGSWQFELRAEASSPQELVAICNRLKTGLGDELLHLSTHSIVRELKYMKLPFDSPLDDDLNRKVA
jgi:DNA-binding Lrp family transcriptional regulator